MSSSSSTKKTSATILATLRYVFAYIERYIKNAGKQLKWTWKQSKWTHGEYVRLHTHYAGATPHVAYKILVGVFVAIGAFFLLGFLLFLKVIVAYSRGILLAFSIILPVMVIFALSGFACPKAVIEIKNKSADRR